ncbi:MAG: type II toxin-antitoxin system VapC family toxin [Phycisphaerae bacterium]
MIVLDTNVVSAITQPDPEATVSVWFSRQSERGLWLTSVTLYEVRYGLRLLPAGKRRTAFVSAFEAVVSQDFESRVLTFDAAAAEIAAEIVAANRESGRTVEIRDVFIASIAVSNGAAVATRNVKHFARICPTVNPWDD